ncbi:DNA primase [Candidatus Woesearchaeota archaeon]|jgi:replicative DNA helicase|nr:DNA primase [Candidatus Woesearchaeota archaeon]|tara:strand:- start:96 stop:1472 length:1377 start_codon:yes stop_codon:yes gene_type:complete
MSDRIERIILRNLFYNEDFTRKALPFIKSEFFTNHNESILFGEINEFVNKYKNLPTKETILVELNKRKDLKEEELSEIKTIVNKLDNQEVELQWLLDTTEKFCKDRAVHNAVLEGIQILDGKDKKQNPEAIPTILSNALAVSFDNHIGHDYIDDAEARFEFYHKKEKRFKFDLNYFNRITKGGVPSKTLNIALAGTGVGKSLFMCHAASNWLTQGKNVLYITLEMAEERIAERVDANLFDVTIDDLHAMPKDMYDNKVSKLQKKTIGQLIIKEYPTASAHSGHFRALLNELSLKKTFKPDVVFIDYLNICASSRFKGGNISSYFYIKAIAEELRGLAVEFDVPIFSATQTTRSGFTSTDIGLEDTAESFGLPATADFMFALISNDELDQLNQLKVKQLKNRFGDPSMNRSFIIGVDRSKMRLFDVEASAQNIVDSNQTEEEEQIEPEVAYDKFSDFKL